MFRDFHELPLPTFLPFQCYLITKAKTQTVSKEEEKPRPMNTNSESKKGLGFRILPLKRKTFLTGNVVTYTGMSWWGIKGDRWTPTSAWHCVSPQPGALSPGMETAGDSGNPKWRLLGYKLSQCTFSVRTKGCHLARRKSCGGRSGGDAERPGLPEQALRPWPGRHPVLVLFHGSDSLDPTVFRAWCLQDTNIRLELSYSGGWVWSFPSYAAWPRLYGKGERVVPETSEGPCSFLHGNWAESWEERSLMPLVIHSSFICDLTGIQWKALDLEFTN